MIRQCVSEYFPRAMSNVDTQQIPSEVDGSKIWSVSDWRWHLLGSGKENRAFEGDNGVNSGPCHVVFEVLKKSPGGDN